MKRVLFILTVATLPFLAACLGKRTNDVTSNIEAVEAADHSEATAGEGLESEFEKNVEKDFSDEK